jgi:hypothetical protein
MEAMEALRKRNQDVMRYGIGFTRELPDGSIEHVFASDVFIMPDAQWDGNVPGQSKPVTKSPVTKSKAGRPAVHTSAAAKQAAYRDRKKPRRVEAQ